MANILTKTEQFDDVIWAKTSVTVTADTAAAPDFAGPSAGLADTLDDADAGVTGVVEWGYTGVANDTSNWLFSLYIKRDAITTRFPMVGFQIVDGTSVFCGVELNTSDGTIADAPGLVPDASGVDTSDPNYWRVWCRKANNGSGNADIKAFIHPAYAGSLGGGANAASTGSIKAWGANLMIATTLQTYEPDPFYAFPSAPCIVTLLGTTL